MYGGLKEIMEDKIRKAGKHIKEVYGEDCPTNQMPELNKIKLQMNLKKGKFKILRFCMYIDGDHYFSNIPAE